MDVEACEKVKRDAAVRVDEWFARNPDLWRDKALWILDLCEMWDRTWGPYIRTWDHLLGKDPPPVPNFHPILWWTDPIKCDYIGDGIPDFEEGETTAVLACYYAALIVLHDAALPGQGWERIVRTIWPESLWKLAQDGFNPYKEDKTEFIGAALRRVEADVRIAEANKARGDRKDLSADKAAGTPPPPDRPIKDRFKFRPGQALFDDKDLDLPPGLTTDVLKKLVSSFGNVVPYQTLDDTGNSSATEAGESLRRAKHTIQETFRQFPIPIPCEIATKTKVGYLIRAKDTHRPAHA